MTIGGIIMSELMWWEQILGWAVLLGVAFAPWVLIISIAVLVWRSIKRRG